VLPQNAVPDSESPTGAEILRKETLFPLPTVCRILKATMRSSLEQEQPAEPVERNRCAKDNGRQFLTSPETTGVSSRMAGICVI
jgi:hypothetical protein